MPSPFENYRSKFKPVVPEALSEIKKIQIVKGNKTSSISDQTELKKIFPQTFGQPIIQLTKGNSKNEHPIKIGVVLSGGQAAGGHNVISGLFDAIKQFNEGSQLIGFIGGPSGIINNSYKVILEDELAFYRNTGGFDLIGSGRTKIESEQQLEASVETVLYHDLDGLVIVGGDDSNTNAAILAEFFLSKAIKTAVVGCPKTIDGDLKNVHVESSFGFDTAIKIYSEMISNICRDALSAKKYYHFIKLMGRSASHVTLECALQTQPNSALIGEEIACEKSTLDSLVNALVDMIVKRADQQKSYGVILIPEGLIEFIPEIKKLIGDLNSCLSEEKNSKELDNRQILNEKIELLKQWIAPESIAVLQSFPDKIKEQLLLERDPHGNVQVSHIETEQLFISMVQKVLKKLQKEGKYNGKFSPVSHFLGYEGRSGFPSNFDANYCYSLGLTAACLVQNKLTGYMACISKLHLLPAHWQAKGIPISMLMNLEQRHGKLKPVIQKALVNLSGKPFLYFKNKRANWKIEDSYRFVGPIQFEGASELCDAVTLTLQLEAVGE